MCLFVIVIICIIFLFWVLHRLFFILSSTVHSKAGDPETCPHQIHPPWWAPHAQVLLLVRGPPLVQCWVPALGPLQVPPTAWWVPALVHHPLDTLSQGLLDMVRTTCMLCTKWGSCYQCTVPLGNTVFVIYNWADEWLHHMSTECQTHRFIMCEKHWWFRQTCAYFCSP